jgi:hypothetical protein
VSAFQPSLKITLVPPAFCSATLNFCSATLNFCSATLNFCYATLNFCSATLSFCAAGYSATHIRQAHNKNLLFPYQCSPLQQLYFSHLRSSHAPLFVPRLLPPRFLPTPPMEQPPQYGQGASYWISLSVDSWITGNRCSDSLKREIPDQAAAKAKLHLMKTKPTLSVAALEMAFCSQDRDDMFGLTAMTRLSGFALLPFGITFDILKALVYASKASATVILAVLGSRSAKHRAEEEVMEKIIESYFLRFEATLAVLMKLQLETPISLF